MKQKTTDRGLLFQKAKLISSKPKFYILRVLLVFVIISAIFSLSLGTILLVIAAEEYSIFANYFIFFIIPFMIMGGISLLFNPCNSIILGPAINGLIGASEYVENWRVVNELERKEREYNFFIHLKTKFENE
jgi:hypothetical protein